MAGMFQGFLPLLLFYTVATKTIHIQIVPSDSALPGNSGTYQVEEKRPFGGVYGRSFKTGKRSLEPDFENAHAPSKRPFGKIFGNSYKLGKREYDPTESHFTVKRPFGRIYGNYISMIPAPEHKQTKRPFGSVYGISYSKRPFGSVYGTSYNKRPFGGVFGSSYKIGKRFAYPVEVHQEMKRPFGKVYGRSYKFGKRPFGQVYGTKYGKRSSDSYIELSLEDAFPVHEKLDENVGHPLYAKRPFGRMYGKREYVEKRPFGQIYSTRPFGKRSLHTSYVSLPILSKRPFGRVYGRSYNQKKRPLKINNIEKVINPTLDLEEYGRLAQQTETADPHFTALIDNTNDPGQRRVYVKADGYDMSTSGSEDQDEDQYEELYIDGGDNAMERGESEEESDFGIEDDSEEFEDSEEE